jgi:hypothetical protein
MTKKIYLFILQKSSIGENWPVAGRLSSSTSSSGSSDVSMKYIVYKQPLSLDRFFIHEVKIYLQAKLMFKTSEISMEVIHEIKYLSISKYPVNVEQ